MHSFFPDHGCPGHRSAASRAEAGQRTEKKRSHGSSDEEVDDVGKERRRGDGDDDFEEDDEGGGGDSEGGGDGDSDVDDASAAAGGGIVPIGTMPMGTVSASIPGHTLAQLTSLSSGLGGEAAIPETFLACSSAAIPLKLPVSFSVFHQTCDPAVGSLTWLAGLTNPTSSGSPQCPVSFCHLANEFLCPLQLTVVHPEGSTVFSASMLDTGSGAYLAGLHDEPLVRRIREAVVGGVATATLSLSAQVLSLFPPLISTMFCRSGAEPGNASRPGALLQSMRDTFTLMKLNEDYTADDDVQVELHRSLASFPSSIPCVLSLDDQGDGMALKAEIDLPRLTADRRHDLLCLLVAADLSRLAVTGLGTAVIEGCERNCRACFEDYFPIGRGEGVLARILQSSLALASTATDARTLAVAVQELIRPWITTANNWTEPCEDEETQPFQWALARALGKINGAYSLASPMLVLRALKEDDLVCGSAESKARLILQSGIGHCREFSEVSFFVLSELCRRSPNAAALLGPMARAEYDDQDHAFVVGGIAMTSMLVAGQDDDDGVVRWDVAKDLLQSSRAGWVCDPYLEQASFRETLLGKHAGYLRDIAEDSEHDDRPGADARSGSSAEHGDDDIIVEQTPLQLAQEDAALLSTAGTTALLVRETYTP